MKPLRVTIYFSGNFPDGGATATRIKGYLNHLPSDIQPTLRSIWPENIFQPSKEQQANPTTPFGPAPFVYLNGKAYRPESLSGKYWDTLASWKNMVLDLIRRKKDIDLIYLYNPELHYIFPIVYTAKLLGIPVIGEQTELQSEIYNQDGMQKKIFAPLKRYSERHLRFWIRHLIVISSKLESFYRPQFGEHLTRIPAFADADRFKQPASVPETFTIGYIGSFGVKDGIPGMLAGIAAFRESVPNIRLKLIGNHLNYPALRRQLQLYGLSDFTELTGPVEESEVPTLLGSCSVLICNRNNSAYAAYGFPSKIVEYAAAGVPVIASRTGDAPDTFGDTMRWIQPEHTEQLSETLLDLYKKPGFHRDLALKSYQIFVEKLTAEKATEQLVKLFRQYARA